MVTTTTVLFPKGDLLDLSGKFKSDSCHIFCVYCIFPSQGEVPVLTCTDKTETPPVVIHEIEISTFFNDAKTMSLCEVKRSKYFYISLNVRERSSPLEARSGSVTLSHTVHVPRMHIWKFRKPSVMFVVAVVEIIDAACPSAKRPYCLSSRNSWMEVFLRGRGREE